MPGNYINFAEYCRHYFPQVASLRNISNFARSDDTYSVAYARIAKVAFTSDCNYTVSNHSTLVALFALQVQLRVAKIVFRRLEGLARKQDFPARGELPQNTFLQAGKFHILIHRQPPVQHFLL